MFRLFSGVLIFMIGLLLFNGLNGAPVGLFINFHGLILAVFLIMSGFIASNWTSADLFSVLNGRATDEKHALRLIEMLSFFEKISIISAVIGIFAGMIILLSYLGVASRIGQALAVVMTMPFYCLIFYMFATVLKSRIKIPVHEAHVEIK